MTSTSISTSGIGEGSNPNADNVFLAASADEGASFRRAIEPISGRPSQRGPLSPDPAHRGSVTLHYESFDPSSALGSTPWTVGLASSRDGGAMFAAPTVFETTLRGTVGLAVGLLRSRAALVAMSADISLAESGGYDRGVPMSTLTEHVMARRSYDGGARFGPPSRVGNLVMRLNDPGGCCLISSAQAPDGTLYATWTALSGVSGGEVLLFRSRDRGATWRRLRVTATPTRAFESSVAVAPDGRVGVLWLQGAPGATGPPARRTRSRISRALQTAVEPGRASCSPVRSGPRKGSTSTRADRSANTRGSPDCPAGSVSP